MADPTGAAAGGECGDIDMGTCDSTVCDSGAGAGQCESKIECAVARATAKGVTVFFASGSPPCWRVLLSLHHKGIPFKAHMISLQKEVQKSAAFRKLNCRQKVPVIVDNGVAMSESLGIMNYLERQYPEPAMVPKDRALVALTLQLAQESECLSTAVVEVIYYLRRTPPEDISQEYLKSKTNQLKDELQLWEIRAASSRFLTGDQPNMADYAVFPFLALIVRMHYPLRTELPNLAAYYERMVALPIVQASWPPHWRGTSGVPLFADLEDDALDEDELDDDLSDLDDDVADRAVAASVPAEARAAAAGAPGSV